MALKDNASLALIPAAYKTSKIYSAIPTDGDGDFTFTRSGSATRINKAGLVETMGTNIGRLDYLSNGTLQSCPSLLLEPSRTNQFTNSENLSNIDFQTNSTITTDNIIAPNGSLTADKTTQTSGGYLREAVSVTNGTTYSFSVFLKKGDLRYAILRSLFSQNGVIPANSNCIFDLDSGSVVYTGTDVVSASIEAYANDWYRCSFVSIASTTNSADFIDFYFTSSSSSTQSSGAAGFGYAWGMQLEQGNYPTSYIPTGTAAVTRTVDTCKLENFTNAPTDYPFTAFVDMDIIEDEKGYGFSILDISSSANYFSVGYSEDGGTLGKFRFTNRTQGTSYNFNTTSTYGTGRYKIAVKFISSTNFKGFIDGVEVADYTHTSSAFNSNINDVLLGQLRVSGDTGDRNPIHQFMIFNEALSDAELQTLTS